MGIITSMSIMLWQDGGFGLAVSPLLKHGWQTGDSISCEHYRASIDMGHVLTAPKSDLHEVCRYLDEKVADGETGALWLYWGEHMMANLIMPDAQNIQFQFHGRVAPLGNTPFTDFGWFGLNVLLPLVRAGCNIREVNYQDMY